MRMFFGVLSAVAFLLASRRFYLTESVGYALSATLLGLCIAVVALIGNGYLQRRIDKHAARLDVLLERVLASQASPAGK